MNTQSHVLLGAALFARREISGTGWAAVAGGLVPDMPLYALFVGARMLGHSNSEIFRDLYWREPAPTIMGAGHSFVIYGVCLAIGFMLWRRQEGPAFPASGLPTPRKARFGQLLTVFSAAALVHALADFFLHHDDAHMQFWPLSRWQFHSPVSYWDHAHYGNYSAPVEAVLGIVCAIVLWRRYRSLWVRAACGIAILMYAAVPAYFIFSIAEHAL